MSSLNEFREPRSGSGGGSSTPAVTLRLRTIAPDGHAVLARRPVCTPVASRARERRLSGSARGSTLEERVGCIGAAHARSHIGYALDVVDDRHKWVDADAIGRE